MAQSLSSLSFCFLIPLYQQANSWYLLQEYSDNQKGEGRAGDMAPGKAGVWISRTHVQTG